MRATGAFSSTYPELVGGNSSDLAATINSLYGPSATPQKRGLAPRAVAGAPSFTGDRQYMTNIRVRKYGLGTSFSVYIFAGGEPAAGADPSTWSSHPAFVGINGVFAGPTTNEPAKAQVLANGVVPLTAALEALLENDALSGMDEQAVGVYLQDNLYWRVKTVRMPGPPAADVRSSAGKPLELTLWVRRPMAPKSRWQIWPPTALQVAVLLVCGPARLVGGPAPSDGGRLDHSAHGHLESHRRHPAGRESVRMGPAA